MFCKDFQTTIKKKRCIVPGITLYCKNVNFTKYFSDILKIVGSTTF